MAKVVNPKTLDALYVQASTFRSNVSEAADQIVSHMNRLADPAHLEGLRGGQGDVAVEAINRGKVALDELMVVLKQTSNFIDSKLQGAVKLAQDKNNFGDAGEKNKAAAQNMNLNR